MAKQHHTNVWEEVAKFKQNEDVDPANTLNQNMSAQGSYTSLCWQRWNKCEFDPKFN